MAVESDTTEFDCPRRSNLSVPSLAGRAKVKGDASPQRASFETAESPKGDPKRVEGILSAAFTGLPQLTFDLEDTIKLPRVSDFSTETSSLATQKEPVIDEPKEADNHEASGPQEGLQEQDGEELEIDELEETEGVNYQVGPIDTTLQDTIRLSLEAKDTMWPPSGRDGLVELAPTVEAVHTEASVNANCTSRQPIIAEDQSDSFAATLSADRRLFWILGACVFIQTVAELIIVVMFSLNKAYLALGVAALCAAPLTVFGMLASWNHGRFLGLVSEVCRRNLCEYLWHL
ncbi:hypothetical protein L0F63_002870 [Massospora cicadina]|nr:hypothetical protein L0F63_002870 [Massospora cicadina]